MVRTTRAREESVEDAGKRRMLKETRDELDVVQKRAAESRHPLFIDDGEETEEAAETKMAAERKQQYQAYLKNTEEATFALERDAATLVQNARLEGARVVEEIIAARSADHAMKMMQSSIKDSKDAARSTLYLEAMMDAYAEAHPSAPRMPDRSPQESDNAFMVRVRDHVAFLTEEQAKFAKQKERVEDVRDMEEDRRRRQKRSGVLKLLK